MSTNEGRLVKEIFTSKWLFNASTVCQKSEMLLSLIVVISAPKNADRRNAIRKSWGKKSTALVFLVGKSAQYDDILKEAEEFGDVAFTANEDNYENLALKTLVAFDWQLEFCPQAEFLVKVDDDVFMQPRRLNQLLRGVLGKTPIILGNAVSGWKPGRVESHKYFVPESVYNETFYPTFVTGPSYAVSKDAVEMLFEAALNAKYIHLEDVFITGILAERLKIPRRFVGEFRNNAVKIPAKFMGCTLLRTISIHEVTPEEQIEFHRQARKPECKRQPTT